MTLTIRSQSEYLSTTPHSDVQRMVVRREDIAALSEKDPGCVVFHIECLEFPKAIPEKHTSIGDLIAELSPDQSFASALRNARPLVADLLYPNDRSVKTLRLKRGLTQSELAVRTGTSQSHIARIEQGKCSVQHETMLKLCGALGVDMNTLSEALGAPPTAADEFDQ